MPKPFHFKQFQIDQNKAPFKVGTDGVLIGAWTQVEPTTSALDIGTGTGLIAIMLAQRNPQCKITAIEINETAFLQAEKNIQDCPWANRIELHHIDFQTFAEESNLNSQTFDLIVSNPPFFTAGTPSHIKNRQTSRHDTSLTHQELLFGVKKILHPQGRFALILPSVEGEAFLESAKKQNLHCTRLCKVKPKAEKKIERLLLQLEHQQESENLQTNETELIIQYKERNHYTPDYVALTKDFYTIM